MSQHQQQFQLVPVGAGSTVPLKLGQPMVIGRLHCDPHDTRISRHHVTAHYTAGGVTVTAQRPAFVQSAGDDSVHLLTHGQSYELHVGDTIFLLRAAGTCTAGFTLQQQQQPQQPQQQISDHQATSAANAPAVAAAAAAAAARLQDFAAAAGGSLGTVTSDEPATKRHKPDPIATAAAAAARAPSPVSVGSAGGAGAVTGYSPAAPAASAGSMFGNTIAAAAWAGSPPPAAATQQQQQHMFAGVQLVDWDGHHTQLALKRAAQEGAAISQTIEPTTTHVIARHELSAAEVQRRLQAQAQKQQRQQRHSATAKRLSPQQQQQQQQGSQGSGGLVCVSKLLSPQVQFVTVFWITSCLKSKQRLPEDPFHVDLQRQFQRSRSGSHIQLPTPAPVAATAAAAAATAGASPESSPAAAAGAAGAASSDVAGSPVSQQQQGEPSSHEKVQRMAHKQHFVVPAPEEICPAGAAWGSANRWIEPWNDDAALESMDQLMAHWHQTTAKHPKTLPSAAAATPGSINSSASSRQLEGKMSDQQVLPFQQQQPQQQPQQHPDGGGGTAPCDHMACSQQSVCLVEEMERLKRNYHGRVDQFRIKAASRAILELERLQQPIVSNQDIDLLPIGEKSKQKLQEILATGRLRRNDVLESSELHRTLQLFMTVWGCADSTARKWWAEGCRSLNDVRNKAAGLTAIQQMGLKYYDDFEQRIPRDEVTEAVSIIRDTVLDVLQDMTGKARSELDHLLHVRALGSYVRGKLDTGDIDMLLAPGPAAEAVTPGPLAAGLLQRLKLMSYVPEGLSLDHRGSSLESAVRVSWMGVWRGPSSPCYRRLDIKTYERAALPYAVSYFSSGQDCSRAIRYWCNRPLPEVAALAAAIHPAANAFHMSDTGLYVVYNPQLAAAGASGSWHRRRKLSAAAAAEDATSVSPERMGADGSETRTAAVAADIFVVTPDSHSPTGLAGRVECSCETDIFGALGLAYVPPHLRSWH